MASIKPAVAMPLVLTVHTPVPTQVLLKVVLVSGSYSFVATAHFYSLRQSLGPEKFAVIVDAVDVCLKCS